MSSGGDYKPTEHDGLKKDGTPDKRVGTGGTLLTSSISLSYYSLFLHLLTITEFAQGKVDPHEAGAKGGQTSDSGSEDYESGSSGSSNQGSAKGRQFPVILHIFVKH